MFSGITMKVDIFIPELETTAATTKQGYARGKDYNDVMIIKMARQLIPSYFARGCSPSESREWNSIETTDSRQQ